MQFIPLDAILARYMLWLCVCVCLSQVGARAVVGGPAMA